MDNDYANSLQIDDYEHYEQAVELFFERGWTDGLPVVLPTRRLVDAMIAGCGRDRNESLGPVLPQGSEATIEMLAINAVMGGCPPTHSSTTIRSFREGTDLLTASGVSAACVWPCKSFPCLPRHASRASRMLSKALTACGKARSGGRHHCDDIASLEVVSTRYITAYRAKTATRRDDAPSRRRFPARFKFDLGAPLRGTIIFVRRSNEKGNVNLLNKAFSVDKHWLHRLVRCEVDFTHQRIRFYALRRRDPTAQPLLCELPYPRPNKPFQGTP